MNWRRKPSTFQVEVAKSYEALSRRAEQLISEALKTRPDLLLCASAGGTPTRLYELLAARHRKNPRLFSRMRVLQIDEWGGLPRSHPASCEVDLQKKLLDPLGIRNGRYTGFRTDAKNPQRECARIVRWLKAHGPIDVCILGLGLNGHIAMNEPTPSGLQPGPHVAKLTPSSLRHPMLAVSSHKPRYGLTLGMKDILSARVALLLVNGRHKQNTLKQLLNSSITNLFPASFLRLHPNCFVLCDREAAPKSPKR